MLFYGLQGSSQVAGARGLGYSGGDYNSGDCSMDNLADCLQCCDASFDPSTDQDGSTACQIDCAQQYPSSSGTTSGSSSGGGSSSGKSSGNANASSQPWYSAFFGSVAQGITTGLRNPATPVAPAAPWYASPGGMGVIAVGLIFLAVVLAKK